MRSPPALEQQLINPVKEECIPPSGGAPWATCTLEFCASGDNRRRLLSEVCPSPIVITCNVDNNIPQGPPIAKCDTAGYLEQEIPYTVAATAYNALSTRRTEVARAAFTIPLYP